MGFYGIFHRALRDLIRPPVLRDVLVTGIPMILVWLGIGWIFWDKLLGLTTWLISWMPFSVVKADGALFILFFVWALAVLVSYAFLTAMIAPIFFRKTQRGYYYYSFAVLVGFAVFWAWFILGNWQTFTSAIANKLLVWLPFQTVAEGSAWLLNFYVFYSLYILSLYLVLAFFRKEFLLTIQETEYPEFVSEETEIKTRHSYVALRDAFVFLILTVLFFPLLLVPIVNVLIQLFLWAWLYRDANFRGTCALFCTKEEFDHLKHHRFMIWSMAFFASTLNFIPIISIFTPFFAQLLTFHWIMSEKKEKTIIGVQPKAENPQERLNGKS
ncbi:EI24 domain-containing protein [Nitratifractor sp.]